MGWPPSSGSKAAAPRGRRRPAPALLLLLAAVITSQAGCPRFQQGPLNLWKDEHYVKLGREKVYVRDRGEGAAVLMIHGYGSAHDSWEAIAPALARRYRVLSLDLPGFGRSDKYDGDYSPAGLARKLLRLLDRKGVRQAHVMGHSWGASIALALALQAPERVKTLTLFGAWVFEEQLVPWLTWARVPLIGEVLYALFYDQRIDDRMALGFHRPDPFCHPAVIDRVRRALGRPGAKAAALAAARGQRYAEVQRRYSTIKQPALLIWGAQDRVSLRRFAHRLDRTLTRSRLHVIEQCGHLPMLERPQRTLQLVLPFLAHHPIRRVVSAPPASTPASRSTR